ncbi:expansin-like A3 isoform X2 [Zingiber officinale]|uniref:expansin-like A3 isoform X2 n=2 Tax=Zingiber officinale TaxID=94328 RepID=UPI001C4CBF51|nr:expansin-like A3 isoform X2 [Zingiber officinale]
MDRSTSENKYRPPPRFDFDALVSIKPRFLEVPFRKILQMELVDTDPWLRASMEAMWRQGVPAFTEGAWGAELVSRLEMRCKNANICSRGGVKVTLTDLNKSNSTDFVLSGPAFMAMARNGMARELNKLGILDVEYKRIPCDYENKNLSIRVEENSRRPNYLAVKFVYQGGQTDIVGVDVARVGASNWQFMKRDYGPVWSTSRAPAGPLQFRMVVTAGYDGKWVWARTAVLPSDWNAGSVYDLGVQIDDVAQEGCDPCDTRDWK